MRKLLLLTFFLITGWCSNAQNRSIEFETSESFSEILAKAKTENKLVFIDAYTTWCGPCKWMSKTMFTNDTIADFFNLNFINAKIDMEKGEGIDIAKKYEVRCYPNLLFLDGDGKLIHRSAGAARLVQDYIDMGEKAMSKDDNYAAVMTRYSETVKKDPDQIAGIIDLIAGTCLPLAPYVEEYYKNTEAEDYSNSTSWKILYYHVNDMEHVAFKHLMDHQNEYIAIHGNDSVMSKIERVYERNANVILYARDFDEDAYKAYVDKINSMDFASKDKTVFTMNLNLLQKKENWEKVSEMAFSDEGRLYLSEDSRNTICWRMYENVSDTNLLKDAVAEMQYVTDSETGGTWAYYDTHAALLFKLKSKAKAEEIANKAIEAAIADGMPEAEYKSTVELLEEIKKL